MTTLSVADLHRDEASYWHKPSDSKGLGIAEAVSAAYQQEGTDMNVHATIKANPEAAAVEPNYNVEHAARTLYHASVMVRATPQHPDCAEAYEGRMAYFREAVADMLEALGK